MGRDQDKQQQAEELSMAAALEAQWAKRKAQFMAHFGDDAAAGVATVPEPAPPALPVVDDKVESKCHVCNAALRRLRVRVSRSDALYYGSLRD